MPGKSLSTSNDIFSGGGGVRMGSLREKTTNEPNDEYLNGGGDGNDDEDDDDNDEAASLIPKR